VNHGQKFDASPRCGPAGKDQLRRFDSIDLGHEVKKIEGNVVCMGAGTDGPKRGKGGVDPARSREHEENVITAGKTTGKEGTWQRTKRHG